MKLKGRTGLEQLKELRRMTQTGAAKPTADEVLKLAEADGKVTKAEKAEIAAIAGLLAQDGMQADADRLGAFTGTEGRKGALADGAGDPSVVSSSQASAAAAQLQQHGNLGGGKLSGLAAQVAAKWTPPAGDTGKVGHGKDGCADDIDVGDKPPPGGGEPSGIARASEVFFGERDGPTTANVGVGWGTATDYHDHSGAGYFGHKRSASLNLSVIPGATVRIYSGSQLDDKGLPKLLWEGVPEKLEDGPLEQPPAKRTDYLSRTYNYDQQAWGRVREAFDGAELGGTRQARIPLKADDDWFGGDALFVTQQAENRAESQPTGVPLLAIKATPSRAPFVEMARIKSDDLHTVAATDALAVPPHSDVQLTLNGEPMGGPVKADAEGRFALEAPKDMGEGHWGLSVSVKGNSTSVSLEPGNLTPEQIKQRAFTDLFRELLTTPPDAAGNWQMKIEGLPSGFALEVANPAAGGAPKTFKADDYGALRIDLDNVAVGDSLTITDTGRRKEVDLTLRVPSEEEGPRLHDVFTLDPSPSAKSNWLGDLGRRARDVGVFGAFAPSPLLRQVNDRDQMRDVLKGMKTALAVRHKMSEHWKQPIVDHIAAHGSDAMKAGLSYGFEMMFEHRGGDAYAYLKPPLPSMPSAEDVGLLTDKPAHDWQPTTYAYELDGERLDLPGKPGGSFSLTPSDQIMALREAFEASFDD